MKKNILAYTINVTSDSNCQLSCIDNLIFLHNYSERISMIYDCKRLHNHAPVGFP